MKFRSCVSSGMVIELLCAHRYIHNFIELLLVCYTAVFSVVTQRLWGGALRDDAKNGCVAD